MAVQQYQMEEPEEEEPEDQLLYLLIAMDLRLSSFLFREEMVAIIQNHSEREEEEEEDLSL